MKYSSKILILLVLSLSSLILNAVEKEEMLSSFISEVLSKKSDFDYDYRSVRRGSIPVVGKGHFVAQGSCFYLKDEYLRVYCDTSKVITIDEDAREIVIESKNITKDNIYVYPSIFLSNLYDNFKLKDIKNIGQSIVYQLIPYDDSENISQVDLYFKSSKLSQINIFFKNKDTLYLNFKNWIFSAKDKNLDRYSLNKKSITKDYFVTDLR